MHDHINKGYTKIPIVIPALVYNGIQTPYPGSCSILDIFEAPLLAKQFMFKPFYLIDLSVLTDDQIKEAKYSAFPNLILKHMRARDFLKEVKEILPDILNALLANNHANFARDMLKCIIRFTNIPNPEVFYDVIHKTSAEVEESLMTIYEQLIDRGRQKGWQEGVDIGRQEGMDIGRQMERAKTVRKLLKSGLSIEKISDLLSLSESEVMVLISQPA